MMNGWIFERFLELLEVFPESLAHSGLSICVPSCGLMAWLLGAHLVAEMCGCDFGSSCCNVVPLFGTVLRGCDYVGVCWIAATIRAALAELFNMKILHAAAASVAALLGLDVINFVVTSEASATEYLCTRGNSTQQLHVQQRFCALTSTILRSHRKSLRLCICSTCLNSTQQPHLQLR